MKPREETKAAALWAFIERIRQEDEAVVEGLSGLTPGDVEQLARLLQTAVSVRRAFNEQSSDASYGAVERMRAAIAAHSRRSEDRAALALVPNPVAALRWRWPALAAVAALALSAAFAVGRYRPSHDLVEPPSRAGVASIRCSEVRGDFARLASGDLPRPEEQAVLAHLSRCPHCRDAYQAYCRRHPPAARNRPDHIGPDLAMR